MPPNENWGVLVVEGFSSDNLNNHKMENIAKIHEEKETIKAIVEAQLDLTFKSVGDEFFLLDGDITLEQTLELEKITLSLTNLLFEWMNDNNGHNPQYKFKVRK